VGCCVAWHQLSHDIQIGELLDNRFEITALIERSGMATIYKAEDRQTDRLVILKLPHLEYEGSALSAARLNHEAAILGKLDHPGIPKVIPVTAKKSRPYVVMEYLVGQTLDDILKRRHQFPECDALRLASRLCDILEYLHRHNVIHCDLKPGNIMIPDDGRPHIIDFGIATEPAWFSLKFGTQQYMAPEQVAGDRVDARTDVYSLGAILYEVVTRIRPADKPVPPRELNSSLSEQVEEIILHAIAPNPSDRYHSAAAMKTELDSPKSVQLTGMYRNPRQASAWPKRLRLAGVIVSLAAAPFVLFFLFLWMIQRQGRP
jgi:serine/threonine protein kinase